MTFDRKSVQNAVEEYGSVARVLVAKTAGSVPREAGTSMLVWAGGQSGTIGGGALEWDAVKRARDLTGGQSLVETIPLGPRLGQCCGGSVTLVTEVFDKSALPDEPVFARRVGPVVGDKPDDSVLPVLKNGWLVERLDKAKRQAAIRQASGFISFRCTALITGEPVAASPM